MYVKTLVLGNLDTNTYLLIFDDDIIVIDPADEASEIFKVANECGKQISCALLTHGHFDHCNAAYDLQLQGVKIYMSKTDYDMICNGYDLARYCGSHFKKFLPDSFLSEGVHEVEGHSIDVINTPGHTAGSISFLICGELFSGDTLFKLGIGRSDLPTGNSSQIIESAKKLLQLDDTNVYPGHGEVTTLSYERKYNLYVRV